MGKPCKFHPGCEQPCPIEAALHLDIQTMEGLGMSARSRAARRRGGQKGGQQAPRSRFVGKAQRLKKESSDVG